MLYSVVLMPRVRKQVASHVLRVRLRRRRVLPQVVAVVRHRHLRHHGHWEVGVVPLIETHLLHLMLQLLLQHLRYIWSFGIDRVHWIAVYCHVLRTMAANEWRGKHWNSWLASYVRERDWNLSTLVSRVLAHLAHFVPLSFCLSLSLLERCTDLLVLDHHHLLMLLSLLLLSLLLLSLLLLSLLRLLGLLSLLLLLSLLGILLLSLLLLDRVRSVSLLIMKSIVHRVRRPVQLHLHLTVAFVDAPGAAVLVARARRTRVLLRRGSRLIRGFFSLPTPGGSWVRFGPETQM